MFRPAHGIYIPTQAKRRHQILLADVEHWLVGLIKQYKVRKVIVEAPFMGPRPGAVLLAAKMFGVIELTCEAHQIPCVEATAGQWRRHFLGLTRAPTKMQGKGKVAARRHWLKQRALVACKARGWPVETDDEADAIGLLDFALSLDFERYGEASRGYTNGLDTGS